MVRLASIVHVHTFHFDHYKMRWLVSMAILFAPLCGVAQGWQWLKQYGGPGYDGVQLGGFDREGSAYLFGRFAGSYTWAGSTYNFSGCSADGVLLDGSDDTFVAKYSGEGTLIWIKRITSDATLSGLSKLVVDSTAQYLYLVGYSDATAYVDGCGPEMSAYGTFLMKWDLDGNCIWSRYLGGAAPTAMTLDHEGRPIIAFTTSGQAYWISLGGNDLGNGAVVASYETTGDLRWWKKVADHPFSYTMGAYPVELAIRNDRIVGLGRFGLDAIGDTLILNDDVMIMDLQEGAFLFQIDPADGTVDWFNLEGSSSAQVDAGNLLIDHSGSIFTIGIHVGSAIVGIDTLTTNGSVAASYLAKHSSEGEVDWVRSYSSSDQFNFGGIQELSDGRLAIAGKLKGTIEVLGRPYFSEAYFGLFLAYADSSGGLIDMVTYDLTNAFSTFHATHDALWLAGSFGSRSSATMPMSLGPFQIHSQMEDGYMAKHDLKFPEPPDPFNDDGRLVILPNPNQGQFQLSIPREFDNSSTLSLRMYDPTGRIILDRPLIVKHDRLLLNVFDVGPGFYVVTLGNDQRTYSGSMVVE